MRIIDANAILRYILQDNLHMADKTAAFIESNIVQIRYEVLAEVVYVLEKVYALPRVEIQKGIEVFLNQSNIEIDDKNVVLLALYTYGNHKLDFVDCILYAFQAVGKAQIFTFDKKLNALING